MRNKPQRGRCSKKLKIKSKTSMNLYLERCLICRKTNNFRINKIYPLAKKINETISGKHKSVFLLQCSKVDQCSNLSCRICELQHLAFIGSVKAWHALERHAKLQDLTPF